MIDLQIIFIEQTERETLSSMLSPYLEEMKILFLRFWTDFKTRVSGEFFLYQMIL